MGELDPRTWLEVAVGGGLFLAGLLVGLLAARAGSRTRLRVRELEAELRHERESHASYQDSVVKHFDRTSDLFRDLTLQYTDLYAHLAEGARDLCADRLPSLAHGFGGPGLQIGPGAADSAPEPSSPDRDAAESDAEPPSPPEPLTAAEVNPPEVEEPGAPEPEPLPR